jgi:hypothetical protein
VDANTDFTAAAKKFDTQLEESLSKIHRRTDSMAVSLPPAPVHVTAHLDPGRFFETDPYLILNGVVMPVQFYVRYQDQTS